MKRRHILPIALAAAAFPAAASAQEPTQPTPTPTPTCPTGQELQKLDTRLQAGTLSGSALPLTGATSADVVRAKTSRKNLLTVTPSTSQVAFDVVGVDGETFRVQRVKSKRGQVQFRLLATFTREGEQVTRRFNVVVKALECAPVETDEDETDENEGGSTGGSTGGSQRESQGRGRGPETEAQREARREREAGERGRGPETQTEREARTADQD